MCVTPVLRAASTFLPSSATTTSEPGAADMIHEPDHRCVLLKSAKIGFCPLQATVAKK